MCVSEKSIWILNSRASDPPDVDVYIDDGHGPRDGHEVVRIDARPKSPPVQLPGAHGAPDCGDAAKRLLECLNLPSDHVKSVRVKSSDVTIHLRYDC